MRDVFFLSPTITSKFVQHSHVLDDFDAHMCRESVISAHGDGPH